MHKSLPAILSLAKLFICYLAPDQKSKIENYCRKMSDLTSSFRHAAASLPFREIKSEGSVRDHGDYHDFRALKHVPTQEALKFSRHAVTLKERLKAVENFIKRVRPEYETVRSLLAADAAAGVAAVMWSSAALLGMSGHSMTDVERDTLDKEVPNCLWDEFNKTNRVPKNTHADADIP